MRVLTWLRSSLRSDAAGAKAGWACGLVALALAVYLSNGRTIGAIDTLPARLMPHTLLHEGDTDFDEFAPLFPEGMPYCFDRFGGAYRSTFPPMAGFLAVPVHAVAHLLPGADGQRSLAAQEKVAAALIAAASVALVFLAAREACGGPASLVVALVYGLGTTTFSISAQALWQHGPAELFLAMSAWVLLRGRRTGRLWPVGVTLGLAAAARPLAGAAVVAVGAYILLVRWRQLPLYLLAGLPFAGFVLWYNSDYGHVLGPYVRFASGEREIVAETGGLPPGVGWWAGNIGANLVGHLVSPNRGLLVYSPVLLLTAHGLWRKVAVERDGAFAALAVACAAHVAIVSKLTLWWGGHTFGPRYPTDVLPFAALFLAPFAERAVRGGRWAAGLLAGLAALSIAVHACGAYSHGPARWNTNPPIQDHPQRVWDWRDPQILAALHDRPEIVPLDTLAPEVGSRQRDPDAAYGWCKRIEPAGQPVTIALQRRLKTGKDCVVSLRARIAGADGQAGELRALGPDGRVVARTALTAAEGAGDAYQTFRLRFPLTGAERRTPFRCEIALDAADDVLLDHLTLRRVAR